MKKTAGHSILALLALTLGLQSGAAATERQESFKAIEINLGAAFPASKAFAKKDTHYALGVGYSWDVDTAFIEARLDFINRFSKPAQSYTAFTLGGNFFFLDEEMYSFFAGANFGLGIVKIKGIDAKGGFHVGADLGAVFLKQADVNLDTRLRLIYNTSEINNTHPVIVAFLVGLRF